MNSKTFLCLSALATLATFPPVALAHGPAVHEHDTASSAAHPERSNAGGRLRGRDRADYVHKLNDAKKKTHHDDSDTDGDDAHKSTGTTTTPTATAPAPTSPTSASGS